MPDLSNIHTLLNTSPEILAREIWAKTFYAIYIKNIWNNVDVWRYITMFSVLLLIFYKKKIRFFQSKEEKIQLDRNVFINSDMLMTEEFLKEFLIELSINESYNKSRYEKVSDFYVYFKQENNKYLDSVINNSVQKFIVSLEDLLKFVDEHFSEIHLPGVYRLYPDLKHDPDFNYLDFQERLFKLCRQTEILYCSYRLNIRTKLSI